MNKDIINYEAESFFCCCFNSLHVSGFKGSLAPPAGPAQTAVSVIISRLQTRFNISDNLLRPPSSVSPGTARHGSARLSADPAVLLSGLAEPRCFGAGPVLHVGSLLPAPRAAPHRLTKAAEAARPSSPLGHGGPGRAGASPPRRAAEHGGLSRRRHAEEVEDSAVLRGALGPGDRLLLLLGDGARPEGRLRSPPRRDEAAAALSAGCGEPRDERRPARISGRH